MRVAVVPSVPDGGSEVLSQSERATPYKFCARVSKMRGDSVQNAGCCSAVRAGRRIGSPLAERESYTVQVLRKSVQNEGR